jgi:serine/threonine protein kinase
MMEVYRMAKRELYETLTGTRIGEYIVDEYIGAGGQAVVYRAHPQQSGGKYALKVFGLLDTVSKSMEAGLAEATKQSQVEHSAVVKVYQPNIDIIEFDGDERRRVLYVPMSFSPLGNCENEPPSRHVHLKKSISRQ